MAVGRLGVRPPRRRRCRLQPFTPVLPQLPIPLSLPLRCIKEEGLQDFPRIIGNGLIQVSRLAAFNAPHLTAVRKVGEGRRGRGWGRGKARRAAVLGPDSVKVSGT